MADQTTDHLAYLEILHEVREHMSLAHTATYLGSKPQNVAGWVTTQSVPTLKDFRARLIEAAYFIRDIQQRPLSLSADAKKILDENAPELPAWGLTTAVKKSGDSDKSSSAGDSGSSSDSLTQRLVSNLFEFLTPSAQAQGQTRYPYLSWAKLALLRKLIDEDKPKRTKSGKKTVHPPTIVIWGETCAGKSTLANALLGAPLFPESPTPDAHKINVLTSDDKVLVEAPGTDGLPPTPSESLQILRYLLNSEDCSLFLVLSNAAFPLVSRLKFAEQIAQLPVKLNLVFSKLDLFTPEDQEQVSRFLRGRFSNYRTFICGDRFRDETVLNELRTAAGLMGTERLKLVAAAAAGGVSDASSDVLKEIVGLVRRIAKLGDQKISGDTTFTQLKLSKPQIGAMLLEVEDTFKIKLPDRDADHALRGDGNLNWLADVVKSLQL